MTRFRPYEARISLPSQHFYYQHTHYLMGHWHLATKTKTVRGVDPYDLSYRLWSRVRFIEKACGSLRLTKIETFVYLRQNATKDFEHTYKHGDLYRIIEMLRPSYSYCPHKFDSNYEDIPLGRLEPSPLLNLCLYAEDSNIHIAFRHHDGFDAFSFWKGEHNLSILQTHEGYDLWTPHGGLKKVATSQDVFRYGIGELRAFL